MKTYPVCLIGLESKKIVVIGGGGVAARKVEGLLAAGASVHVISPEAVCELRNLANSGAIELTQRSYRSGDLQGAFLVVAATDDELTNQAVFEEASQFNCLVNVVDNPKLSNFIVPAVVRRGDLMTAISTGGASPALARLLKDWLESLIDPQYGELVELLESNRPDFVKKIQLPEKRLEVMQGLVDSGLLEVLKRDGRAAAQAFIEAGIASNI